MPESEDLYEILHLHPSAHPDVIQAAYRRLALLYHPDKNPSPEATEMMAAVNRAYAVLSDPEQRAEYDRSRASRASNNAASGPSTASGSQASRPQSGAPSNPAKYFTIGSTKIEVLDIQGSPNDIKVDHYLDEEVWEYQEDIYVNEIKFNRSTGCVTGWTDITGSLKSRIIPGPNVTTSNFFISGTPKDEVVRLQGTPWLVDCRADIGREIWMYEGGDKVEFSLSSGCVIEWQSESGNLKVPQTSTDRTDRYQATGRENTDRPQGMASDLGQWRLSEDEYSHSTRSRDVTIYTVDQFDPEYSLVVRFKNGELDIFLHWNQQISLSDTKGVSWQIDEGRIKRELWYMSDSHEATFIPEEIAFAILSELYTAETFKVWVSVSPRFGKRELFALFRVDGFGEAFRPVFDAMKNAGFI